jgi:ferric-dicitrate binding protein FerR (iron transport regulator)
MSQPPPSPLSEQERADLVAFLDGELSGEAARAIEAKISLDPRMRAEADSLKRAWEMLDFLPQPPEPAADFTEKTLSRLEAFKQPSTPARIGGWLIFAGVWGLLVVFAGVGGYYSYQTLFPREPGEAELLRDLRLIENQRYYDRLESFEFLQQLDHPDLFGDETNP